MNILHVANIVIISLLAGFLLLPFIINIVHLLFYNRSQKEQTDTSFQKDIACVITAYKNLDLAVLATDSLLKQDYSNYHIYIVADECDLAGLDITHPSLSILRPDRKLGSKVKSMKYAIDNFTRSHDAIAIFDPDNLAHKEFLNECNKLLSSGHKAVQGKRVAKNLDTRIACLDAMGEIYYNHVTKEVPSDLGSSSIIAGSGMVIETALFKGFFDLPYIKERIDGVIPGEDKILHYYIVSENIRIVFSPNALIYDEKVSNGDMVRNQRTRWINSYLLNLSNAFNLFAKGILSFNFNKFLSGVLTLYPPLFLLVLVSLLFIFINLFISIPLAVILFIACSIFVLNFILVLKIKKAHPKIWAAFWGIPYFMFNQVLALFNLKKSNKDFLTTKNEKKITLEEVIKNS